VPEAAPSAPGVPTAAGPVDPSDRIEHLLAAAKNLEAAGYHDQAARLLAEVNRMDVQARERDVRRRAGTPAPDGERDLASEMDQLRRQVRELRAIVQELTERVERYHRDRE
jgi:hypothetical protein